MIERTIYQAGNSAVICIPSHVMAKLKLHLGDKMVLDWLNSTTLAIWPKGKPKPPGLLFTDKQNPAKTAPD